MSWKVIQPKTRKELKKYFDYPLCHQCVVIYESIGYDKKSVYCIVYVNGQSGSNTTGELKLNPDVFSIETADIGRFTIFLAVNKKESNDG